MTQLTEAEAQVLIKLGELATAFRAIDIDVDTHDSDDFYGAVRAVERIIYARFAHRNITAYALQAFMHGAEQK